ncbi:hypothetical protein BJV78DRAFT_1151040 [Lactifluus subvellereus]|nr:hypothetical protein BJV78DRAFT_1151040 [Lactifluus subvellereus]
MYISLIVYRSVAQQQPQQQPLRTTAALNWQPQPQFAPPPGQSPGNQPLQQPGPPAQPPSAQLANPQYASTYGHPAYTAPQYAQYTQYPMHNQGGAPAFPYTLIERETLAGMPPWPPTLKLSLNVGNWHEWSRHLTSSLAICQLDDYPLNRLLCPDPRVDTVGHRAWTGNDRMILSFMRLQMNSSELQQIAACATSAEAYAILGARHEKRTQIQLIQRLSQIWFDDDPNNFERQLAHYRDLLYQIESMGSIDVNQLGLFFLSRNLKVSHPTVHEALAPAIMNGSITEELLGTYMYYYFEMRAAQITQSQNGGPPPILGMGLPAFVPDVAICNNCKKVGHSAESCVAPGGKRAGLSTYEAVMRQRAACDANRGRMDNAPNTGPTAWTP